MRTRILTAVLAVVTGCNTPVSMAPEVAQSLKGREGVAMAIRRPDFIAMTEIKQMLGAIGIVAAVSAGNEIVEKGRVEDPAPGIAADLARALSRELGAHVVVFSAPVGGVDLAGIRATYPATEVVLDVETIQWGFTCLKADKSRYRVALGVKARLQTARTGQVLARGIEWYDSQVPPADAPTYDELIASDAARLKLELKKAAEAVYSQLLKKTFNLDAPRQRLSKAPTSGAAPE